MASPLLSFFLEDGKSYRLRGGVSVAVLRCVHSLSWKCVEDGREELDSTEIADKVEESKWRSTSQEARVEKQKRKASMACASAWRWNIHALAHSLSTATLCMCNCWSTLHGKVAAVREQVSMHLRL
ncbi:none [Leptomonas seymouri]|uniref:None n=1 Tax=Leptomonas seymouri TaxID=5684 RepID=A0A0N1PB97_LEPSE|nr:none [Leptomonas seymouri]|eukprot:KPI86008.1 none [Leptomonas seymouri]